MNTKSRIASIRGASSLDFSVTGLPSFSLSELQLSNDLYFPLPTDVRLGHLAEKVVSECIKLSDNYAVKYENVQIMEGNRTIGEIDFIIEEKLSTQLIHVELAYKFYLYDPNISSEPIKNWIGPNRNDSLVQKLDKLTTKQFPLLFHNCALSQLENVDIGHVSQALCLLVSLFVPYAYEGSFSPVYERAIRGYFLDLETFTRLDSADKVYYVPPKKEWGMDPSENETWTEFNGVYNQLARSVEEQQAPLCWQKSEGSYSAFFIVWW
jgi:hypothetical protein